MKILRIILILLFFFGMAFYFIQKPKTGIYSYNEKRDKQFILDIFQEDWHWLVSEYSKDFSSEFTLTHMTSSKDPATFGSLIIKVYLEKGNPVGFIAYHKIAVNLGYILFLDMNSKYRRKGYSEKLVEYACKDMKNKGFSRVRLITRVTNERAIPLYRKMGFVIIKQDEEFVDFEKKLK